MKICGFTVNKKGDSYKRNEVQKERSLFLEGSFD